MFDTPKANEKFSGSIQNLEFVGTGQQRSLQERLNEGVYHRFKQTEKKMQE